MPRRSRGQTSTLSADIDLVVTLDLIRFSLVNTFGQRRLLLVFSRLLVDVSASGAAVLPLLVQIKTYIRVFVL